MTDLGTHVGECSRCGRPVHEEQSYVMVAPLGRGRVFYHAGCEPLRSAAELARGELESSRIDWRKDAWQANRTAARRSLTEPQD